jgi:hypothetical protein
VEAEAEVEVEAEAEAEEELPLQEGKQQVVNHTNLQPSMVRSLKSSMGIVTISHASVAPSRSSWR